MSYHPRSYTASIKITPIRPSSYLLQVSEILVVIEDRCQIRILTFRLLPALFRCNSSQDCRALESMYQDMQCQYHLVPEGGSDIPNTPALTAAGFVRWMVCCILAAPDQEAYRLDKIVQALPIETRQLVEGGGGGLPERLPKQLSRHLLPVKPNETTKDQLLRACKAKKLPTAQSSAPAQNDSATPPRHSSSKRGREDHRDDNSRRYVPQTRVNDGGRDRSRSRSGYQHSTRHESDKTPRRSSYDHRSPDRTSKHYPDASPRSNRRSSIYETSRSKVDDSYYRDRGHGEKTSASLKRTSSTKDSRRHMSPPRDSRQSYRDWSPNRYSHSRKGSRHESSSGSSPRDSFDNDASGDSRGRHERQGSFSKTTGGDSARAKRRA